MQKTSMDRRSFVRNSGITAFSWALSAGLNPLLLPARLLAAEDAREEENPNWADHRLGISAGASSQDNSQRPGGYAPMNVVGDILQRGWETEKETSGAWLELDFGTERPVRELWLLAKPLPYDIVLDPYMRGGHMATPRKITYSFSNGASYQAELRQAKYFQIITLPREERTKSIRFVVNEIWPEAGSQGTGLGKVRVFPKTHAASFQVFAYAMYDARGGAAVQSATVEITNPGGEIRGAKLQVSRDGGNLSTLALSDIPARSVSRQDIWIPAPFEDAVMEFKITGAATDFKSQNLRVPAYHCYFDRGTFDFLCTNHNDLGWLDTQAITADYRSAELILPAMQLLKEHPEFRYSMECVVYLIEFLERHPEKREEMAQLMREGRFTWGASYVENLEVHVGPEKLVRQFYLGRKWLRKNFPGADSRHYVKTDPPSMTFQMPQVLAKAGVPYVLQGRFAWGFYNWEAPDGSTVFVFAYRYGNPRGLPNPKGNQGWLSFANAREYYYAPRHLPPMMIYDINGDYLPPPPSLIPYVREQNEAMKRFAAVWNAHYASQPNRQIQPPTIRFVEPEADLDELTKHDLNIETVKGDWPLNWVYYDEPSNRDALWPAAKLTTCFWERSASMPGSASSPPCLPTRARRSSKPGGVTAGPTTAGGAITGPSPTRSIMSPTSSRAPWRRSSSLMPALNWLAVLRERRAGRSRWWFSIPCHGNGVMWSDAASAYPRDGIRLRSWMSRARKSPIRWSARAPRDGLKKSSS